MREPASGDFGRPGGEPGSRLCLLVLQELGRLCGDALLTDDLETIRPRHDLLHVRDDVAGLDRELRRVERTAVYSSRVNTMRSLQSRLAHSQMISSCPSLPTDC